MIDKVYYFVLSILYKYGRQLLTDVKFGGNTKYTHLNSALKHTFLGLQVVGM